MGKISVQEANAYIEKNRQLLREMWEWEADHSAEESNLTQEEFETLGLYYNLKLFEAEKLAGLLQ